MVTHHKGSTNDDDRCFQIMDASTVLSRIFSGGIMDGVLNEGASHEVVVEKEPI